MSADKTHQPTEQKRRKARDDGNIPRSKLLSAAAVTFGGLAVTLACAEPTIAMLLGWTSRVLSLETSTPELELFEAVRVLGLSVAPTLGGALAGALIAGVPMAGLSLNLSLVHPKPEKLNPAEGLKKLVGARQLIDLGKGLAIALVIALVLWSAAEDAARPVFRALHGDALPAFSQLLALLMPVVLKATGLLLALGLADYGLARLRHTKDLMMSLEEVKQEHKNSEGDPHAKGHRKQLMKKLAMGGPARGVHKATAVVVNPTHIAVAIRYDETECDAPYIVALGREEDALSIRKAARELGIPVVRDVPLARTLIHSDVGDEVPEELYQAAAAVLRVALESTEGNSGSSLADVLSTEPTP